MKLRLEEHGNLVHTPGIVTPLRMTTTMSANEGGDRLALIARADVDAGSSDKYAVELTYRKNDTELVSRRLVVAPYAPTLITPESGTPQAGEPKLMLTLGPAQAGAAVPCADLYAM
jgi:hypothetical protein